MNEIIHYYEVLGKSNMEIRHAWFEVNNACFKPITGAYVT